MEQTTAVYYYKIYDDKEQFNFIKSTLMESRIRELLKSFETSHQQYYNNEFLNYLKEYYTMAQIIEVNTITY